MMIQHPAILARSSTLAPLAAVAAAMLSITIGASVAKGLFPVVGAAGTTALRLVIAAAILAGIFRLWRTPPTWAQVRAAAPYGVALGCMNLLFYMSIQRIPLGIALAIEFTGPLVLAVFLSRRRADLGWVALAVLGLLLLLPLRETDSALDPVGVGLALVAGVFWSIYILAGRRAGAALGARAAAIGTIFAALVVLPFGVAEAGIGLLSPPVLAVALAVAILSSAIPYSLEMFALRRLPAKSFSLLTSGEPAVGAMVGAVMLGEMLPAAKWLGIAAIVAASLGTTLSAPRPKLPA